MRSGLELVRIPRSCKNPECEAVFTPKSNSQVWCAACRESGVRRRLLSRAYATSVRGRECRWCGISDAEVAFHCNDECGGCRTMAHKHGRCQECGGRPLRREFKRRIYCPRCDPPQPPATHLPIMLLHAGRTKLVFKSPGGRFIDPSVGVGGRPRTLAWLRNHNVNDGDFVMLVSKRDFIRETTARPLAVKGLPGWPTWQEHVGKASKKFLNDLADLLHFVRLGEADPIEFHWWHRKFYESSNEKAARRNWERFKKKLRGLGLTVEMATNEDESSSTMGAIRLQVSELEKLAAMTLDVMPTASKRTA